LQQFQQSHLLHIVRLVLRRTWRRAQDPGHRWLRERAAAMGFEELPGA
jgi:hypothetical protein